MTPETLTALKLSIKHWEENLAAEEPFEVSIGANSCALCKQFRRPDRPVYCAGCPVRDATELNGCAGSPFEDANKAHNAWCRYKTDRSRDAWREAARAELDFLKSLLPEDA